MSAGPEFWVDGHPSGSLPLPDRGQEFGDGLFETLLVLRGTPQFPDHHEQRLHTGFQRLRFAGSPPALAELIAPALAAAVDHDRAALRLTLSRAAGARGYTPGGHTNHRSVLRLTPLPDMQLSPASLGLSSVALATQPALAGIKHLNRLEQVIAAAQRDEQGVDEVLTCDQLGNPVAVSAGNLFIRIGNTLSTPPVDQCGIAGTRRQLILERWAAEAGYVARETVFSLDDVRSADEVFFCNTLTGIRAVAQFEDRRWQAFPASSALQKIHTGALSTCCA
jgi:4-amino-4-deoxychorismate lyase